MNDSESLLHYGPLDVLRSDLSTLEPGKRLDDQMIRLGLGLWKDDLMKNDPDLAGDLVVQDTRFYRSLSNKGYQGILKSDKRVDILKTRFIIVPIHQNDHWYLAIIYGPGALVAASTSPGAPPPNANPLAGTAELETTAEISSQRQSPYVFIFDSLGIRHPEAITTLQDWLRQETKRKYNLNHEKTLTGIHVEVPHQENNFDCGVYLLHFVEIFFKHNKIFISIALSWDQRQQKVIDIGDSLFGKEILRTKRSAFKSQVLELCKTKAPEVENIATVDEFENMIKRKQLVIFYFRSSLCPPCNVIDPFFESLNSNEAYKNIQFCQVDIMAEGTQKLVANCFIGLMPSYKGYVKGVEVFPKIQAKAGIERNSAVYLKRLVELVNKKQ